MPPITPDVNSGSQPADPLPVADIEEPVGAGTGDTDRSTEDEDENEDSRHDVHDADELADGPSHGHRRDRGGSQEFRSIT
jgi:hypothetical protein